MKTEQIITREEHAQNAIVRQGRANVHKWGYRKHDPSTWHEIIQQQAGQLADAVLKLKEAENIEEARAAEQQYERELVHIGAACLNALTESSMD